MSEPISVRAVVKAIEKVHATHEKHHRHHRQAAEDAVAALQQPPVASPPQP